MLGRFALTTGMLAAALLFAAAVGVCAEGDLGVAAPEGFEVQVYADDELAHDIYCMTVDQHGRVVVSGAGYTRILFDENGDGRADSYKTFADGPASGAQGMYFDGPDLIAVGDAGVLRYRDRDGDDRADGPPEVLLRIRTGGEHHAHAIRRGPDGYWYLLAGNDALVTKDYITDPHSPVKEPRAGVLLRLSPDFSSCSVVIDGLRNSYDFDFHPDGGIFIYDSDDERDVTLPWYRPTRVFQVALGANAGWVSRSWKHPDYFFDMPPVVAQLGRGSPTGVVCYRHQTFPEQYRTALFVADWTFGRVYVIPLQQDVHSTYWTGAPQVFLKNVGQHGFAPTDLEVAPDGALLVSVGGRGTRGGVLRVSWCEQPDDLPPENWLQLSQPLSSWSRARWQPLAQQYYPSGLVAAIGNATLSSGERQRALEMLTWMSRSADYQLWDSELINWPVSLRVRMAWSLGRFSSLSERAAKTLQQLLPDEPRVVAAALESLLMSGGIAQNPQFEAEVVNLLQHGSYYVRLLAARNCRDVALRDIPQWMARIHELSPEGQMAGCLSLVERSACADLAVIDMAINVLQTSDCGQVTRLEATRILQLAVGDAGPQPERDPVFDGYAPREVLVSQEQLFDRAALVAALYPTGQQPLDTELERWLAMIGVEVPGLVDRVLENICTESHPTRDIHCLIVIARLGGGLNDSQVARIASAFAALDDKVQRQSLHQDRNWAPRLRELFLALSNKSSQLTESFVNSAEFGHPAHGSYLDLLDGELKQVALDRLLAKHGITEAVGSSELLMALGASASAEHRQALREFSQIPATANLALIALAQRPHVDDLDLYYEGVQANAFETVVGCLAALERLAPPTEGKHFAALVTALARLEGDQPSYQARERAARLLERAVPEAFGFIFGSDGYRPQPEVVARWQQWVAEKYPAHFNTAAAAFQDLNWLDEQLAEVDWSMGDAMRGNDLFLRKACHQCHGGRTALGPDLAGVTGRFSIRDLFTAIAFPSLHVSSRYQTTIVETHDGHVYHGAVVYESVDGVTLITGANRTVRIDAGDIAQRSTSPLSLMPTGLLEGCGPQDYADLVSYLKTLAK